VLVQVVVFLPIGYAVTSKSLDYGAIAEWLVKHRPSGTPYVFESGYDQRFVPGTFPTPGLVAAVPYVHGAGAEEIGKLRQVQQQFFLQYPEACFVEASRHGFEDGSGYSIWEWPHKYFRRVEYIWNKPLHRMVRAGIAPSIDRTTKRDIAWVTPVWFNTPEDSMAVWREAGQPIFFSFVGWEISRISQAGYGRVVRGPRGVIQAQNLRGTPVQGKFVITGGFSGPEQAAQIELQFNGEVVSGSERWPGQLWSIETEVLTVEPGRHVLTWNAVGDAAAGVEALLVSDAAFLESTE
jgi:hypothetical protein